MVRFLVIFSLLISGAAGFLDIKKIIQYEKNDYARGRLENKEFDFYRRLYFKGNPIYFVVLESASHLGELYILSKENAFRLSVGLVYNVLSSRELLWLKDHEVLIISSTGGSGEHHVFACLLSMESDAPEVRLTYPIYGESNQGGMKVPEHLEEKGGTMAFPYKVSREEFGDKSINMPISYSPCLENILPKDQKKIVKDLELKVNNELSVRITKAASLRLRGQRL